MGNSHNFRKTWIHLQHSFVMIIIIVHSWANFVFVTNSTSKFSKLHIICECEFQWITKLSVFIWKIRVHSNAGKQTIFVSDLLQQTGTQFTHHLIPSTESIHTHDKKRCRHHTRFIYLFACCLHLVIRIFSVKICIYWQIFSIQYSDWNNKSQLSDRFLRMLLRVQMRFTFTK